MKAIEYIIKAIAIIFFTWILLSYIEVVSKNKAPNPEYSEFNAFILISEVAA